MNGMSLQEIWFTSPAIVGVLSGASLMMFATALERLWFYSHRGSLDAKLWGHIQKALAAGKLADAVKWAQSGNSLLARSLSETLSIVSQRKTVWRNEIEDVWMLRREESSEALRKGLVVFGTLSFIAPLIGLLGTVLGILTSFKAIADTGIGGPDVVAAGVSEALVTTVLGVIVAVPALIFHNGFSSAMASRLSSWDRIGQELTLFVGNLRRRRMESPPPRRDTLTEESDSRATRGVPIA